MNSTPQFDKIFEAVMEQNVAAPGGVFGDNAGANVDLSSSGDTYAPGDARLPKVLGKVQRRNGSGPKVRKKKKQGPLKEEENIKGGLASGKSVNDIAEKHGVDVADIKEQLKKGIKVEMEHTDSVKSAREIALDHLMEIPNYYDKLETIEKD